MTTDYPRLPLLVAYLVDFVRKSFGLGPKSTINLCEAFHTIFWGLFPVPSALVARLLRFAFGHGRNEVILRALNSKKAKSISKVLCIFLFVGYMTAGVYAMVLYIFKHGWWALFIWMLIAIGVLIGVLILLFAVIMGVLFLSEHRRNSMTGRSDASGGSVSAGREVFSTVAVMWHFIVSVKRRLCPIYANPLYRGSFFH